MSVAPCLLCMMVLAPSAQLLNFHHLHVFQGVALRRTIERPSMRCADERRRIEPDVALFKRGLGTRGTGLGTPTRRLGARRPALGMVGMVGREQRAGPTFRPGVNRVVSTFSRLDTSVEFRIANPGSRIPDPGSRQRRVAEPRAPSPESVS